MKSKKPWVDALSVPQDEYLRWCESVPANNSVTYWCLAQGYISPGEYLKWAQEFYGLATLRPEFFENPPDKKVFNLMKSVANWSPEMIPIHEWDGVVYVACVEPIKDMKWSFPVCYVLASSSELRDYWDALQAVTQVTESLAKLTVAPPLPPAPPAAPAPVPPAIEDAPGGLNLNFAAPARKERDFLAELASAVAHEDEIPTQIKPMPPMADLDMPAGFAIDLSSVTPPMPEQTFTAIRIENPVASVQLNQTNSATIDQGKLFGDQFFKDMNGEFDGAMILVAEGERLNPWAWDEHFAAATHKGPHVDLSKPSAFRIAYRTKMPYLGHVVDTPTNQEFFGGWGYSQMPESIVAYPLLHENNFYGVLLLKAKKSQKQSHLLASSEQFSNRIAHALAQFKVKAA